MVSSTEKMSMLLQAIDGLQTARYTSAAATTIYVYNIFLTLDLEVEHFWKRISFNLPTLLYMINRYVCIGFFLVAMYNLAGFHGDFTDEYCKSPVDYIGFTLAHAGWTGIMTLRVCALWRQRRALVWFIQFLWVSVVTTIITTGYLAYLEMYDSMSYNHYIRICAPAAVPLALKLHPLVPSIYELFLTVLTLIKAFDFGVSLSSTTLPLIYRILARDGVAYFVISTTISAVNMITWYCLPNSQLYLLLSLHFAIMSTFMAKMMLNLKHAHHCVMLEQMGTENIDAEAFGSQTRVRSHVSRFIMGQRDLEGAGSVPKLPRREDRGEAGNTPNSQVPQNTTSVPLKRMSTKQTGWSGGDYAETLPGNASGLSLSGSKS